MQVGLIRAFAYYLGASVAAHLAWEVAQMPLYTLWKTGSWGPIAFAIVHCTAGDVLIAGATLLAALLILRAGAWPVEKVLPVALLAISLGVGYTAFSEWLNVYVRQSWAYDNLMPLIRLGAYDIGLAPIAQWLVVPGLIFGLLARMRDTDGL